MTLNPKKIKKVRKTNDNWGNSFTYTLIKEEDLNL